MDSQQLPQADPRTPRAVYSIDEAFLTVDRRTAADVEAMERLGRDIKDTLRHLLGVPVCVGIAPTRTLAKLAYRTAKKVPVFDGVRVWPGTRPEWRQRRIEALPVSEVWSIAGRLMKRLAGYGVTSIWDLATADPVQVRKWFNVVVMRTALELRGIACIGPEEDRTGKKDQLIVSRSFSEKVTTVAGIRQALCVVIPSRMTLSLDMARTACGWRSTWVDRHRCR